MKKSIVLLIALIAIILSSCDKNNEGIEVDPFLTWKIGFEYPENWHGPEKYTPYESGYLFPKEHNNNCVCQIVIYRHIIENIELYSFSDEKITGWKQLADSGNTIINSIDLFYYKYGGDTLFYNAGCNCFARKYPPTDKYVIAFSDQYLFIDENILYEIRYEYSIKKDYDCESYMNDFHYLLNSIYIKGKS